MVWGIIRVTIFTTAFLFGLLLSGSRGSSADSKSNPSHSGQDTRDRQCEGSTFFLTHETENRQVYLHRHPGGM